MLSQKILDEQDAVRASLQSDEISRIIHAQIGKRNIQSLQRLNKQFKRHKEDGCVHSHSRFIIKKMEIKNYANFKRPSTFNFNPECTRLPSPGQNNSKQNGTTAKQCINQHPLKFDFGRLGRSLFMSEAALERKPEYQRLVYALNDEKMQWKPIFNKVKYSIPSKKMDVVLLERPKGKKIQHISNLNFVDPSQSKSPKRLNRSLPMSRHQ